MTATTSKLGADMKDHEIAQTVNQLRDIAKEYGQTQQLRERIAAVIVPILARQPAAIDGQEAERYRYLRNAVGVILDCSHAGPWKFGSNIDVVVDEWLAQKAARTSAPHPANEASKPAAPSVEQDERRAWDGDSEESRAAFRAYDAREPVSTRSSWQIWRDACAWQARAASPANVAQGAEAVPTERGVYAWVAEGSAALVLVHTRPSDHSPGGVLKASVINSSKFYDGCPVDQWAGGTWFGPLRKDALTAAQSGDTK